MLIGQISELSGYSQRMIRYLEDQGLITPHRSDSNLRRFTDIDLTRVLKIKRLKELGFTYFEIKTLIDQNESLFAEKGVELLLRHHDEAHGLIEKIRRLEVICFGETKTKPFPDQAQPTLPKRVAYRIKRLDEILVALTAEFPDCQSELNLMKFGEFLERENFCSTQEIEIAEIFKITQKNGTTVFRALLPYQAVFLASGQI